MKEHIVLMAENDSDHPAFDLDYDVIATYGPDELPVERLREEYLRPDERDVPIRLNDEEAVPGYFGIVDRVIRHQLPGKRRLTAELDVPPMSGYVYVFLQYRSPLGVNYGQIQQFADEGSGFEVALVAPQWIQAMRRLDLFPPNKPWWRRWPAPLRADQRSFLKTLEKYSISGGYLKGPSDFVDERGQLSEFS